jgi:hypothetical protein
MNLCGDLVDGEPGEVVEHDCLALAGRKLAKRSGE